MRRLLAAGATIAMFAATGGCYHRDHYQAARGDGYYGHDRYRGEHRDGHHEGEHHEHHDRD
ncbi:MAG: hypothetical protein JWN44_3504 [Myxococcales bacterium]|nr:hypothetical protein [Myxococcales bacterium]